MRTPAIYRGTVIKFEDGKPLVEVPALGQGYTIGPCETTTGIVLAEGARVLCVSVSGIPEDVVVVGELDPAEVTLRLDFDPIEEQVTGARVGGQSLAQRFTAVEGRATELESDVSTLQGQVASLLSRVAALEADAHTHP